MKLKESIQKGIINDADDLQGVIKQDLMNSFITAVLNQTCGK